MRAPRFRPPSKHRPAYEVIFTHGGIRYRDDYQTVTNYWLDRSPTGQQSIDGLTDASLHAIGLAFCPVYYSDVWLLDYQRRTKLCVSGRS